MTPPKLLKFDIYMLQKLAQVLAKLWGLKYHWDQEEN
jgi:hypothetical protein